MKYKILSIALALLTVVSCDDFLDSPSQSEKDETQIFSDPLLTEGAIMGIYHLMGEAQSYRNRLTVYTGVNTDIEMHNGSKSANGKTDRTAMAVMLQTSALADGFNNTNGQDPWSRLYSLVEQSNQCIEGIRKYGNPKADNAMGPLLAEALTLRAFFYNDLCKLWGDVPARFEPVNSNNLYLEKTDRTVIYEQIMKDLDEAISLLPWNGTATTQRVSKAFAKGLRARIALMAAGKSLRPDNYATGVDYSAYAIAKRDSLYNLVKEDCLDIIKDGGYSLTYPFVDFFKQQCAGEVSQKRESIFELPFSNTRGEYLSYMGLRREENSQEGSNDKYASTTIKGEVKVSPYFMFKYASGDTRRDVTCVPYKYVNGEPTITNVQEVNLGKWRAEWSSYKITNNDDGINFCVMRYADILLMAAEAINELDGPDAAKPYLVEVRNRAFNNKSGDGYLTLIDDISSKEAFQLAIENERAFEFCGENIRKWDLMRWGKLKERMNYARQELNNLRNNTNYSYAYYRKTTDGENLEVVFVPAKDSNAYPSSEGWTSKDWTIAKQETTGLPYLDEATFVNLAVYQCADPDKRQLLPIMNIVLANSQGKLSNDYEY